MIYKKGIHSGGPIILYIICFFIPSTTKPQITNSIPKIKLNLNKIKPIVKSIGIVNEKLYVRRIARETKQIIKQNFNPWLIISLVNLSRFLKLLKIFFNIIITYTNSNIKKYKYQWKFIPLVNPYFSGSINILVEFCRKVIIYIKYFI